MVVSTVKFFRDQQLSKGNFMIKKTSDNPRGLYSLASVLIYQPVTFGVRSWKNALHE